MSYNGDNTESSVGRPQYKLYCMYRGPGPAYQMKRMLGTSDHCITKKQAPAFSIGIPYKWKTNDSPGPLYNYDANLTHQGIQQPPSYSLSGRPRKKAPEVLPGPGAYDSHNVKDPLPRISMGQRLKQPANDVPPPNAYSVKTGIGSGAANEKKPPSCTIRSRPALGSTYYPTFKAAVPGPAAYGVTDANRSTKSCTIKSRYAVKEYNTAKEAPGPGAYEIKSAGEAGARRGFSMGIRHSEYLMPLITCHDMY